MTKTAQHSSYWLDKDLFRVPDRGTIGGDDDTYDISTIARYAAVRRAIANFVSILSGKNVPVEFSSGQSSYTDGQAVVISAENDPSKFDTMVGLALHEASHILLTKFHFLNYMAVSRKQYETRRQVHIPGTNGEDFAHVYFPKALIETLPWWNYSTYDYSTYDGFSAYCDTVVTALNDIQMLMNILEDRRIDKFVYTNAGGYRPYYQAMYDKYFFTNDIEKNLRFNPEWRKLTVENYINRLLLFFHPAADPDALPGLRGIIQRMDINTIDRVGPEHDPTKNNLPACLHTPRFENTPIVWQEACTLYAMIIKLVAQAEKEKKESNGTGAPSSSNRMVQEASQNDEVLGNLPNLDNPPQSFEETPVEQDTKGTGKKAVQVEGKYNEKKGNKDLEDAKKMMNGDAKKKKMTRQMRASVTALEEASGDMVDISGDGIPKAKCLVTRRLTERLMAQDWFIFGRAGYPSRSAERSIIAGKRMGQILVQRLQVRNDPMLTKQTRLPHGGLDRRLLAQLGMDITSVFQKSRTDIHRPAMLHLSLDASSSMSGIKWEKVRTVAVALAYLGSKMRNVDTVISIRGGHSVPIVSVLFDSRRDQLTKFCKLFACIHPTGATPEGLCFKATLDLITENAKTHDVYFINFSDGEPSFYVYSDAVIDGKRPARVNQFIDGISYNGTVAFRHTRQMVKYIREEGVKVLSYYITETTTRPIQDSVKFPFRQMYGEDAAFVDIQNCGEVLVTLNRLLRERGS